MVKGVAVRFRNYKETIPKMLEVIKFADVVKNQEKIVLKPDLINGGEYGTPVEFVEEVLKFCVKNKNPGTEIFIAEGCDGFNTGNVFGEQGYQALAEKYGIGLIDLTKTENDEIENDNFLHFNEIFYPKILSESFIISRPIFKEDEKKGFIGALSNMVGAFPSKNYKGFLTSKKNKLNGVPFKYQVHDILRCKMPGFAIADASEQGYILAGQTFEIDRRGVKLFGKNEEEIKYLRLIRESFYN